MSISSVLAFVLAGVAAKAKSVQVAKRSEDRTRALEARIAELEDAIATANVQARRDQELIDIWRERALGQAPQVALQQRMQAQQALLAQYNPQQALLAQYNQHGAQNFYSQSAQQYHQYQNQLLGAQNLIDAELFCNCVPARHDMFLRGR